MMNKKHSPVMIAVGRDKLDSIGVDLLLPSFPWFKNALARAENHKLNFGFGALPAITVEDLIIIKLYASRFKDLDDLESIFSAKHKLDLDYIKDEFVRLNLRLPPQLRKVAPKKLVKI